jgi:hypothetical protein
VDRGWQEEGQAIMLKQKKSSFDRIKQHLETRGETAAVPRSLDGDLETVVRRCDEVRSLGNEYGSVELSPYMLSLLHVSSAVPRKRTSARMAAVATARG